MTWVLENISLIFTLMFFLFIFLGSLLGFIQGAYKNIYYLIVTLIIVIGGFFLIPVISKGLLNMDLYKIPFSDKFLPGLESSLGVQITSIKETLPRYLSEQLPEYSAMFVEGSEVLVLANGIATFVLNIVLFILLLVLNATLFKLIAWIIWLIIRPKKKSKKSNELIEVKRRKYRLIGAASGAIRGFIALFIISIPLAGVVSIGENVSQLLPLIEDADIIAQQNSELSLVEDITKGYRRSVMGSVYGLKIKETRADERVFDSIFQIRLDYEDGKKEKIKLRSEINSLVNIINIVLEKSDYKLDFDLEFAFQFSKADIEEINKNIEKIKLINVIKNVGAEYVFYALLDDNIDDFYEEYLTLDELKKIDLNKDIQKILGALTIIADSEAKEEILENVFALKEDEVTEIFELISSTSLIKTGLTFGANMFFASEMFEDFAYEYDLDSNSVVKPTPEKLVNDFKNIVNIYTLAYDIGFTDQDQIIEIQDNIALINDEHINELFKIVFDFTIIYDNDELFATFVYDQAVKNLPDELKDFLTKERIKENFNATELSHLAIIGKMFLDADLLGEGSDYLAFFTEANIEKLSDHVSKSNLLSEGIEHLLNVFLDDDLGFTIEIPPTVTFKGQEGKSELINLFNSARLLLDLDLEEGMEGFSALDNETIEEIATYFSSSKVIAHNLGNIIETFTDESDEFQLEVPDDLTFYGPEGKTEIEFIFKSLKTLSDFEEGIDSFADMEDDDIDEMSTNFSSSRLISHNLANVIESFTDESDEFQLEMPDDITFYGAEGKQEIESIFKSFRDISAFEEGIDSFNDMSDQDIDLMSANFSGSKLIAHNFPNLIDSLGEEGDEIDLEVPEEAVFYGLEGQKEISSIFKSLKDITVLEDGLDSFADMEDDDIDRMSENFSGSRVIAHNLPNFIDSLGEEGDDFDFEIPEDVEFYGAEGEQELSSLFKSLRDISVLEDGTEGFKTLEDPEIDEMSTNFSSSKIIVHNLPSIIDSFTEDSADDNGFEIVQPDDVVYEGEEGQKELAGLFKSFRDIAYYEIGSEEAFKNLEDEEIETMSENFSSSKIITYNLTGIINSFTEDTDYDFISVSEDEDPYDYWTQPEIENTFKGISVFAKKDLDSNNLYSLDEDERHQVALSITFSNSIRDMLHDKTQPGGSLEGKLEIPEGLTYHSTDTEIGEVEHLFKGLDIVLGGDDLDDINLDLSALKALDLEDLFESKILEATAVEIHIKPLVKDTLSDFLVEEYKDGTQFDWYMNENPNNLRGDTLGLIDSANQLDDSGLDIENMDYNSFKSSSDDHNNTVNMNDALISSNIFKASLHKLLNEMLVEQGDLDVVVKDPVDLSYWGEVTAAEEENRGELYFILDALSVGDGFSESDFEELDTQTADNFKLEVKKINNSETLRPILGDMLEEEPLIRLENYRYEETDQDYQDPETFTKEQWDEEIDRLVDIMVILNDFDITNFDPIEDMAKLNALSDKMDESILYDKDKLLDDLLP